MVFLSNVYTVFLQVVMVSLIIGVGVLGDKTGLFTEKAAKATTDLLFYIITPCMIIDSFLKVDFSTENAGGLINSFICSAVFHIVSALVIMLLFNKQPPEKSKVFKFSTMYANVGYMGIPLSKAVLDALCGQGELGVFYCSASIAVFNICCFTHGVSLMSGSKKIHIRDIIVNPGTIAVTVGVILFVLKIKLPSIVATPVSQIGSMAVPLGMLMFGAFLSNAKIGDAIKDGNMYVSALFKLVLIPLAVTMLMRLVGIRGNVLIASSIFMSAPTACNTVLFSAKYGADTATASEASGISTVFSILTMPFVVAIAAAVA